jgi:putative salt-induced outer membrane protein YdiY
MADRRSARVVIGACVMWLSLVIAPHAAAQDPSPPVEQPYYWEEPVKVWTGALGAGLAMTKGNTDTSTYNVSYELTRDAKQRLIFKSTGLFIQSEKDDVLNVDRTSADIRIDYRLTYKLTLFGRLNYLSDSFKQVDYLLSPTVGVGYAWVDNDRTQLSFDASLGTVFERNPGFDLRTSPALALGQRLTHQITSAARVTQQVSALVKLEDFGDALYTFGGGLSASITSRSELKAEVLDSFKAEVVAPVVSRNDVSILVSVVYKF